MGVNFYLMKRIFLHIGLNCKNKFLQRPEFSPAGRIFSPVVRIFSPVGRICTLRAQIFTVLTEVWLRANRAMVTNNSTVLTEFHANRNRVNRRFPVVENLFEMRQESKLFTSKTDSPQQSRSRVRRSPSRAIIAC